MVVILVPTSREEAMALERGAVGQASDAMAAMQAVQAVTASVPLNAMAMHSDASFLVPLSEQATLVPHRDFSRDIPVIDLSAGNLDDTVAALTNAATTWGVFQVVNHGIPASTMNGMMAMAKDFFARSEGEKLASANIDQKKHVRQGYWPISDSFQKYASWSSRMDYVLRPQHLSPTKEAFPSAEFRATVEDFGKGLHQVLARVVELVLTAYLGPNSGQHKSKELLDADHSQVFRIASYEPCLQPDAVMGIRSHVDHSLITGLVQDNTGGLQVEKDGQWHGVPPLPGAVVILIGTAIQVVTNDTIKAMDHRVVVNGHSSRISLQSALNPSHDSVLCPVPELVDEMHPPLYRPFKYGDFRLAALQDGILKSRNVMEKFRITAADAKTLHPVGVAPHRKPLAQTVERDGHLHDLFRFEGGGIQVA